MKRKLRKVKNSKKISERRDRYHKHPREFFAYRCTDSDKNRIRIETGLESQNIRESSTHSTGHGKIGHPKISSATIYVLITSIQPNR